MSAIFSFTSQDKKGEGAYQVVVCELGNVTRLNAQVLEGLGLGINHLVDELSLNLVSGESMPPEHLVHDAGNRLEDCLGDVDVSSLLVDFGIHHGCDLAHAVLLGAVELKRLTSGGVIVEDLLKGGTNINGL